MIQFFKKKGNALSSLGRISEANTCFYEAINQVGAFEITVSFVFDNYKNIGKNLNVNPSEKSPTFKLWDESHGGLRQKRRQAFSPPGEKPQHSCCGGGTRIQKLLKSRYGISMYQKQLKDFLMSIKLQIKDQKEQEDFEEFKKNIPYKNRVLLADYVEGFLKYYGSEYKNHIPRLHRFLQDKNYDLTYSDLENFIRKQKNKMAKPGWGRQKSIDLITGREFEDFLVQFFNTC